MSHTFTLTIDLGNAAFREGDEDDLDTTNAELARIVKKVGNDLAAGRDCVDLPQKVRDLNGNTVGNYVITDGES